MLSCTESFNLSAPWLPRLLAFLAYTFLCVKVSKCGMRLEVTSPPARSMTTSPQHADLQESLRELGTAFGQRGNAKIRCSTFRCRISSNPKCSSVVFQGFKSFPKDSNADEDVPLLDDDVFGELRGAVRIELYDRSWIARRPQHVSQVLIHRSVASCKRC